MFSQTTEYALRIMVYLGGVKDAPATNRQISAATQIPPGYLAKILQLLSRHSLVRSQRGLHGGSTLAASAKSITLMQVVSAVEPLRRITGCPLSIAAHGKSLCPLHKRLDETISAVQHVLESTRISDLIGGNLRQATPLCVLRESNARNTGRRKTRRG